MLTGKRQFLKILRDIFILFLIIMAIGLYMQRNAVTGVAPAFQGALLDDIQVTNTQFRGKPLLIHFWATWCGICRFEQNNINNIAKEHQVITIAMSSGEKDVVQKYMQENGLSFPVLNDPYAEISKRYGVKGVPASFIVDSEGEIQFTEIGYTTEWGLRFRIWMASL